MVPIFIFEVIFAPLPFLLWVASSIRGFGVFGGPANLRMQQSTPWPLLERLAASKNDKSAQNRDARLSSPALRARYACDYRDAHRSSYESGSVGEPCVLCGVFSHAFCETCFVERRDPPYSVCTTCDGEERVCLACESAGRQWADGAAARADRGDPPEGVVEVSAFKNEQGETVRINPPLLLPLSELDNLEFHILRHCEAHGM